MPNWSRSISYALIRLSINGTIITMMQLPSIKQPKIRKMTLIIISTTSLLSVMESTNDMNSCGI